MWLLGMVWVALAGPADEALGALVEGREARALQVLRQSLGDDEDGSKRCLLGEVALRVGRNREALDVLEDVPEDALCAGRAAFVRAEALRRSGQLDAAAERYEALTQALSSPPVHPLSERLEEWGDRLLAEEPPHPFEAASLLALAVDVEAEGSERRLALARRLAELVPEGHPRQVAIRELSAVIAAAEGPAAADRRRIAPLLGRSAALELLSVLPDDAATMAVRVQVVSELAGRHRFTADLLDAHPDSAEALRLRREVGLELASAGWVEEARTLLGPLADDDESDGRAAWALAQLSARAGSGDAVERLNDVLSRYPTASFRSEAEALLDGLQLDGLRAAAAAGRFDGDAWDRVATTPPLALEAAWATSDLEERARRLDALVARWPRSSEARVALRHRALSQEDGLDWLRERSNLPMSGQVLAELLDPEIGIRTPDDPGVAEVELLTRGLDEVDLRLHRIDVEGWLRAGGRPGSLGDLDVSIVAPDASWTVPVPDTGRIETRFAVPVPVPGPGLYAVTAATSDREARTLLLVSDARVLARAQGPDLAMVALRNDVPSRGARFWVRAGGQVLEVRADGEGLARTEMAGGPAVVVAQTPGGPALLEVGRSFPPDGEDPVQTAVDLDRPSYRPGDVVRFRALGTRGSEPVRGTWKVWLSGGTSQVLRLEADRSGAVEGELVVPWTSSGRRAHGAGRYDLELRATLPGKDSDATLATLPVIDEVPGARRLAMDPDDDGVRLQVLAGDGVPVADQPVHVVRDEEEAEVRRTDATGTIRLVAPPQGLPWSVAARLPGDETRSWTRPLPMAREMGLELADPRAQPGEPVQVELDGEGPALLRVVQLIEGRQRPEPIQQPIPFTIPELEVFSVDDGPVHRDSVHVTVRTQSVNLGEPLTLKGLDEGRYLLQLVHPTGRAGSRSASLEVRTGTRVRLAEAPRVGRMAEVSVDGGWALLTVEAGRMLDARVVPPGRTRGLAVDRRWHGRVELVATSADDAHRRALDVDAALSVEVVVEQQGARWQVAGQVTDAAGNPQRARVVVRAVDELAMEEMGVPPTLSTAWLRRPERWTSRTARAWRLVHGGWAEPLAEELLAEVRRQEEAQRRSLASEGRLAESRVAGVLDAEVPLGAGGLGMVGAGYGGGGSAAGSRGSGNVGLRGGKAEVAGEFGYTLYGARDVGLWRIVDTDRDGRFTVLTPSPDPRRTWRVEAIAVVPGSVGRAHTTVAASASPWVAVDPLRAGFPGDVAAPRAHVVNPGEREVAVDLEAGELRERMVLAPGAAATMSLGELVAGADRDVVLKVGGQEVARATARFPVAEGTPRVDGSLAVTVQGREGGTVVGAVALMDDPQLLDTPAHAVAAGRAALAALPVLDGAERDEALRRIWAALGVARSRAKAMDLREQAQALRLATEAVERLDLPSDVMFAAADAVTREPETPQERLELAFATARTGRPVEEATVGRLIRDADRLDEEGRGMLARLLVLVDPKAARKLASGVGVQWILAADEGIGRVDADTVHAVTPPPLGDPARADWVRALVLSLGRSRGTASRGPGWRRDVEESSAPAPVSWREAPPEGLAGSDAVRVPDGRDGRLATVPASSRGRTDVEEVRCGSEELPCRIEVGEGLALWHGARPLGGLQATASDLRLQATTPGRFRVWRPGDGTWRLLHVEVVDSGPLTPLGQGERLAVAELRRSVEEPFEELLSGRSSLEDWRPELRGAAAALRFAAVAPEDAQPWIAAFEDLRDEVPSASIARDDVVRTAQAYQRTGRPDRALQVYEQAIGSVFLEEASRVSEAESYVGELAGVQALREVTLRYPAVPVVRQAEFALPDRLLGVMGSIPETARERGVTDTELQLMAAAWDRRFVALAPDSPLAPEAGLRLATGLIELDAQERALDWVQRLRRAYPENELTDRWMLLEALLLTELQRPTPARRLLAQLSDGDVALGNGTYGRSALRDDARLAQARLAEAERRWEDAASQYRQVASSFPEAALAAEALTAVRLELMDSLVARPVSAPSRLEVRASNVDEVQIRAYAVDLRTLFLRESGLPEPGSVRIDGLRPAWSGARSLGTGPFPDERTVDLPLQGAGAWLVRLDADNASALGWVLRTDLDVHHGDLDGQRRLTARLRGVPVADARVRAVGSSGIEAATTDVRGVALVSQGARALVQVGPHTAFTDDVQPGAVGSVGSYGAPRPAPSLLDRVQGREEQRRAKRKQQYDYIGTEAGESIEASRL